MSRNPIINIARENWDPGDAHACASEWLYQTCRLWTDHQSPQTGICPVDYRDPDGPVPLDWAVELGEDATYWDAVLALWADQGIGGPLIDPQDPFTQAQAADWDAGYVPEGYDSDQAMRHIRVALHTFHRIYRLTEEDGV